MSRKTILIAFLLATLAGCDRSGPSSTAKSSEHFQTRAFIASIYPDRSIVLLTPSTCAIFTGNDRVLADYTRHRDRLRLEPVQPNASLVRNFIFTSDGLIEQPTGERFLTVEEMRREQYAKERDEREKAQRAADEEFRKKTDEKVEKFRQRFRHPESPPSNGRTPPYDRIPHHPANPPIWCNPEAWRL